MCDSCGTYYSHKPCPRCQPRQKVSNAFNADKLHSKTFLLAPSINELDFIWAQITKKTIQRVQSGSQVLRQGFFNIQYSNKDIDFEWIGSTFNQGFYSRLERLYPGTESIVILNDIIAQNFNFEALTDLLNDIINVNKKTLKKVFILWLEPYLNSVDQYQEYKNDIKQSIDNFIKTRKLNIEILEFSFPLYSTDRFSKQLQLLLFNIIGTEDLLEYLENKLPLRPLFRTQRPLLDPNAPNRVIILDLEKSASAEPIRTLKVDLKESVESHKCLACSSEIKYGFKICLICKFTFCNSCVGFLEKEYENGEEFCLGSIYHGLHRPTFY